MRAYELLDTSYLPTSVRVRDELDQWYRRLPPAAAKSIYPRFVSPNDTVHLGAFFELFLHELALRLCDDVDIDAGRDTLDDKRPDLLVRCGGDDVWVEATAVSGYDFHDPTEQLHHDQIHDAVNAVTAPAFGVDVEIEGTGQGTPAVARLTRETQRWLDGIDPDDLFARQQRSADAEVPSMTFDRGGWVVRLEAYALAPEHRDYPHHRVIGGRSFAGGGIDDVKPIVKNLKRKATHYGPLDRPFIVALLCAGSFVDDRDIDAALFGRVGYRYDRIADEFVGERQRNGVWMQKGGPVNTRVSGVLTFTKLDPSSICVVQPTLWTNPWAANPLRVTGPWRRMEGHETGHVEEHPMSRTVANVLGLPERWPVDPGESPSD